MDELIVYRVMMSFVFGGVMIALLTFLAEKLGTKYGGILAGFPGVMAVSLFFIGLVLGADNMDVASGTALLSLLGFGAFCLVYVSLAHCGFMVSVIGACLVWGLVASLVVWMHIDNFIVSVCLFLLIAPLLIWATFQKNLGKTPPKPDKSQPYWGYIVRFFIGGTTIALVVLFSSLAGDVVGGVFAGFPATALSSIIILNYLYGAAFTAHFIKHICLGGVISCSVYVIAIYFFYPLFGLILGTLVSLCVPLSVVTISYAIHSRMSVPLSVEEI